MAFDITTAKVIEEPKKKFDITTAKVIEEPKKKFDITTAKVIEEPIEKTDFVDNAKNTGKQVTPVLETIGSKIYDGINTITKPAVDTAKNIKSAVKTAADTVVTPITKIANASVPININYKEIEKEPQKPVTIIRARTAYDDSPYIIRSATPIIRARTKLDDIRQTTAQIDKDSQGLVEQDPLTMFIFPATGIAKGAFTKTGAGLFELLIQSKNAIVRNAKGEQWNPFDRQGVAELIPEDMPGALRFAASVGEMVADGILTGQTEKAVANKFIYKTANDLYKGLIKKGWDKQRANIIVNEFKSQTVKRQTGKTPDQINEQARQASRNITKQYEQENLKQLENGTSKSVTPQEEIPRPINADEAIAMNIRVNKMELPEPPQEPLKADMDINVETEPGQIGAGKNIVNSERINKLHSNDLTDEQISNALAVSPEKNKIYQTRSKESYKKLLEIHKNFIEKVPQDWNGTVEDFKKLVNWDDKEEKAVIHSPIENIQITKASIHHLFKDNEPERKTKFLRAVRTIEHPNIITDLDKFHYYIKFFDKDGKIKNHIQIVKVDDQGNIFYVTQHGIDRNSVVGKYIKEGQVIYDLSNSRVPQFNGNDTVYSNQNQQPMSGTNIIGQNNDVVKNNLDNEPEVKWVKFRGNNIPVFKEETPEDIVNKLGKTVSYVGDGSKIEQYNPDIVQMLGKEKLQKIIDLGYRLESRGDNVSSLYRFTNGKNEFDIRWKDEEINKILNNENDSDNLTDLSDINSFETQGNNKQVATKEKPIETNDSLATTSSRIFKNKKTGYDVLHQKAKTGDIEASIELADKLTKGIAFKKRLKDFVAKHPNAVLVPMRTLEASGDNQLPQALADKVANLSNLKIYDKIYQVNETHHTGSDYLGRLVDKAEFAGEIVPELEYIVVDDVFTSGSNINELRKYIEANGGKYGGFICFISSRAGRTFKPSEETLKEVYKKYGGKEKVDELCRETKIAESTQAIPEILLREVFLSKQCKTIDDLRTRITDRQNRGVQANSKTEGFEGEVLRRELNSEQSNNNSTDLSLSGKTRPAYSSALKTDVKINSNEKPKMSDFKLYQRTYDLAKKYMVNNIAESKYRPRNTLGVYYNYGSRKGNIYLNSLLNVDVVAHELVHAIDDKLQIINDLYEKGFKAVTTFKGKKAITTFIPDISTPEGKAADELLKAAKDLYPTDISKQSVKSRLAEGLATLIQHSIINPDMIENFYGNAYKWAMSNETLQSFRDDARQIIVDYESLNPVEKLTTEIYDKAQKVQAKTKIPLGVRIDSQLFDSEAVLKMLDKDLYLTAKGYRTVLKGILENNLTNKDGKMYIIDSRGNPVKVSDNVNWRTLIEDVQKAQSEFNGYLVARRFVTWYENRDKIANGIEVLGNNLKKLQQKYNEVSKKIKKDDFYNIHEQKAAYNLERSLRIEIDKLTRQIKQEGEKLQNLQSILEKSGKNEQNIKDAYKFLDNAQNRELAKKYDFLMRCNLTVLRTAKLIDKEMYNELVANYGYAPFNRVAYNELTGDGKEFVEQFGAKNDVIPKIVSSNWNIKNLKKIEGSQLPILSPLYSSIQLMKEAYKKSYKQIVANRMGEIAELYPELMQKVPYKTGDEKNNSKLVIVGTDKATGKERKQTLEMDPFVKKVWDSLIDNYKMSVVEKMMVAPAKFFTLMTTAENPIFAITNFARDQITASVNSDMGYVPFFTPIMTYVKCRQNPELRQYFDEYNELFGESNTFLSNLDEVNPDDLAQAFKTNALYKIFGFGTKALSFLPNLSEVVTRRTEYVKARGAGFDIITAKRLADEVSVPFGDRGLWGGGFGRVLLRSVPYMNAGLQVIRQGIRSLLATKGNNLLEKINVGGYENLGLAGNEIKENSLDDKEIEIAKRFIKFLDKETIEIHPHETMTQKQGENFFGQIKEVIHNELGKTLFVKSTVGKLIGHQGFDIATIIRLLPKLFKDSVLIDSPTEKEYTKTKHKQHNNIAFWHNTLNKFKIGNDNYIIRFTVAERKAGQNKKKGTVGERYLHSSFISGIEIQKEKDGNVISTGTIPGRTLPSDSIIADYIKIVNKFLKNQNNNPTNLFLGGKGKTSNGGYTFEKLHKKGLNNNGFYEYKEKNKLLKMLFAMIGYSVIQAIVSLWWDNINDKTRKNLKEQLNPAQFIRFAYLPWGFNDTDLLRLPWEQLYSFPAVIGAMIHDELKNDYDYKLSEYAEVLTGGVIPDNFNVVVPLIKSLVEKDNSGWEQLMYRDFPQIVKIGLMLGGGKKTYPTLQDIVPKYLQKREKAMQYDEKTSDLAKFLGKQFNIAPIKLDYYLYNVAGQVGSMFEKGAEFIIDKLSGKTETGLADFITGNVTEKEKAFRKTVMPWLQESYFIYGREMQQFYDEKEKFEALEKSHKEGLRKLNSEELKYLSANAPHIRTISKRIKDYNKFVKNATDNRNNLTFKKQKENEKTKINMENQIIDLLHKWKRAVKKAVKKAA